MAGQIMGQALNSSEGKPNIAPSNQATFNIENQYNQAYNLMINQPAQLALLAYQYRRDGKTLSSSIWPLNRSDICCLVDKRLHALTKQLAPTGVIQRAGQDGGLCGAIIQNISVDGRVGKPLLVQLGEQNLLVKLSKIKPRVKFIELASPDAPPGIAELVRKGYSRRDEQECWLPQVDMLLGCDSFTNELLIANAIQGAYDNSDAPGKTFIRHMGAALCQKSPRFFRKKEIMGLDFMEYADLGSLEQLKYNRLMGTYRQSYEVTFNNKNYKVAAFKPDFVMGIIYQLVAAYDYLFTKHQFTHGDAKVANILMAQHNSKFTYKGIAVDSPVTAKIGDYDKASIGINVGNKVLRIYNRNPLAERYLRMFNFTPELQVKETYTTYKLSNVMEVIKLAKIRHSGLPFYRSFDIYTLLTSMFMMPEFFVPIYLQPEYKEKIWDKLWLPSQNDQMAGSLLQAGLSNVSPTYTNVLHHLDDIDMKCDVADEILKS